MITLAGHGKDSRLIQAELPLVPNVGDRIREDCNNKTWGQPLKSLITEGEFIESVEKYGTQYWKVSLDNGKTTNFNPSDCEIIERAAASVLVEEIKSEIPLEPVFKVGDRVVDTDGEEGVITAVSNTCLNISKPDVVTSHNLKMGKPKLRTVSNNNQLFEILLPICDRYSGRYLPTFAVNAIGHALDYAKNNKSSEAIALLSPDVLAELKKPTKEVAELKKFLENFSSIDADKLPNLETPIASEPKLSVTKLRMDESKVSVLVEVPKTELEILRDRLADLQKEAIALESSGASPKGVWLEKSRPSKRNFDQVVWKSAKPHKWLNDKRSRYIGKLDHDEHKSAQTQFAAGKRLQEIQKEIKEIEKKIDKN